MSMTSRSSCARAPSTAPCAPVVVDVAGLDETSARELPLHDLAERLRACKLVPVGAANLPASAVWNAAAAGMAIVELTAPPAPAPPVSPAADPPAPPSAAAPDRAISTLTIRQPVRSGQVIY